MLVLSNDVEASVNEGSKEKILLKLVVNEVEKISARRKLDGFNEINFTAGVLNCFVVIYIFGAFPQHFWLVYFFEMIVFLPLKLRSLLIAKPMNNIFYLFDFCWIMNFSGVALIVVLIVDSQTRIDIRHDIRPQIYCAISGLTMGPLFGACLILPFVAVLFHDAISMTSFFIHFLPPMLIYTFAWQNERVTQAWPDIFVFDYLSDVRFFPNHFRDFFDRNVFGLSLSCYLVWWIFYTLWQILFGLRLPRYHQNGPRRGAIYDTVFHSTLRGGLYVKLGTTLFGQSVEACKEKMDQNNYNILDLWVYMCAHLILFVISMLVLAYPCYQSQHAYVALLIITGSICVYRGSQRYTYYVTKMYGKGIKKVFSDAALQDMLSKESIRQLMEE